MNQKDMIEERLERLGESLEQCPELSEKVMEAVRRERGPEKTVARRRLPAWGVGVAAAAVLLVALGLPLLRQNPRVTEPGSPQWDGSPGVVAPVPAGGTPEAASRPSSRRMSKEMADFDGRDMRFGFIDLEGEIAIPPIFTYTENFSEGLAVVSYLPIKDHGPGVTGVGYINTKGELVIPPVFDKGYAFREGLAPAAENGKWGYIDKTGNFVIPPRFDQAWHFKNAQAPVIVNDKWGLIDREGNYIIEPKYRYVCSEADGMIAVAVEMQFERDGHTTRDMIWGFCDAEGNEVIEPQFLGTRGFSEGLANVCIWVDDEMKETRYGYIDKTGNVVIPFHYGMAEPFEDGKARVSLGDEKMPDGSTVRKYFYIDREGEPLCEPRRWYHDCLLKDGVFYGTWTVDLGYDPEKGRTIWETRMEPLRLPMSADELLLHFAHMGTVKDGMLRFYTEAKGEGVYGFADLEGNILFEPRYKGVHDFAEGLARFYGPAPWEEGDGVISE